MILPPVSVSVPVPVPVSVSQYGGSMGLNEVDLELFLIFVRASTVPSAHETTATFPPWSFIREVGAGLAD